MELIFLGTSAGVPTRSRNVTAAALKRRDTKRWYLIDCGEGTQQQVLRTPLSLNRLEAIFVTHHHGDHCYGLPGLLSSAAMAGRTAPLTIVGPATVGAFLEAVQASTGLHLTYPLEFVDVEAGDLELADYTVTTTALSHGVASYAYAFTEKHLERHLDHQKLAALNVPRGPAWGRLHRGETVTLEDGTLVHGEDVLLAPPRPRKVIVGGDNDTPGLLAPLCAGADVLVHEATYTQPVVARLGTNNTHSTAAAVASFAAEARIANLVLTHFSPRYQNAQGATPSIADIAEEARRHYRGTLYLAEDFARYRLSPQGELEPQTPARR